MRIEEDMKLDFSDVLIRPKRSNLASRKDVTLQRDIVCKYSGKTLSGVPIMNSNMGTSGTFKVSSELTKQKCFSTAHKFYNLESWENKLSAEYDAENSSFFDKFFFPMGLNDADLSDLEHLILEKDYPLQNIMIDVANGYSEKFVNFISRVRNMFPDLIIAAGNVATPDMTEALILSGADIIKVNIGAGSCCTTRLKAGVGYPQLSAVIECADAAHGLGGHIISDGGCVDVADFCKAFGAGADIVMSGSFFAATDESDCDEYIDPDTGKIYKVNYGMSSKTAQDKYGDGMKDYRSSEGRTVILPPSGPTKDVINDILGGIRSCCTYVGANKIKELPKRTTFIKVNNTHNTINESNTIGN